MGRNSWDLMDYLNLINLMSEAERFRWKSCFCVGSCMCVIVCFWIVVIHHHMCLANVASTKAITFNFATSLILMVH